MDPQACVAGLATQVEATSAYHLARSRAVPSPAAALVALGLLAAALARRRA